MYNEDIDDVSLWPQETDCTCQLQECKKQETDCTCQLQECKN